MKHVFNRQTELTVIRESLQRIESRINILPSRPQEWIDPDTMCKYLKVSRRTLRSYTAKGWIPYSRIGNNLFYRLSDVDDFLSSRLMRKSPVT